jgi:alpha-1,2-mannosyltransferase
MAGAAAPARASELARTAGRLTVVGAAWVAAWFDSYRVVKRPPVHDCFDLRVYRGAVQWWLHGGHLYAFHLPHTTYGFTYPPFAAICMLPLAWLGFGAASGLVTAASATVVAALTWWLVAPVAERHGWSRWFTVALALPVVVALDPIRETLGFGQINMLLFGLVMLDVVALRRQRGWAGVGIGLATALKLTPGLFVVFLLLAGRRRAAAVATGTFLAASLLAFAVSGSTSTRYWTSAVWDTSRVGHIDRTNNQSLLGVLARLTDPAHPPHLVWGALVAAVLAVGLTRAVRAYRAGDDVAGVTLVGVTGCLVSPISWTHHMFWVVPALVILLDVAAGAPLHVGRPGRLTAHARAVAGVTGLVVGAGFVFSVVWVFADGPLDGGALGMVARDGYALLFLALLALLPVRGARVAVRTPAPPRPAGSSPR